MYCQVPATRGCAVLGAEVARGDLQQLLPEGPFHWHALLPDGTLVRSAAVADPRQELQLLITSPGGQISRYQAREVAGQKVPGWVRTGTDGQREWVADEEALGALRAVAKAAAEVKAREAAEAAAQAAAAAEAAAAAAAAEAGKKGGKGAKGALAKSGSKERAASGSGVRPVSGAGTAGKDVAAAGSGEGGMAMVLEEGGEDGSAAAEAGGEAAGVLGVEGALVMPEDPLRVAQLQDPDTEAVVYTREDLLMLVAYADGSTLLQVSISADKLAGLNLGFVVPATSLAGLCPVQ